MSTKAQISVNRRNARKSTGPKTAEGKAAVAHNAVKHGLFAHENVVKCEKQADFDAFREELLAGLAPAGGVEAMMAERIVSLSWRLKRVERLNSEAIDVMIAKIETDSFERRQRREAGLLDPESGRSELVLGWAMIEDFSKSNVLERLLMYEKRIESSLYKSMNEFQKLQRMRKREQAEAVEAEAAQPSLRQCSEPVLSRRHPFGIRRPPIAGETPPGARPTRRKGGSPSPRRRPPGRRIRAVK
jgi:hypothetical protein